MWLKCIVPSGTSILGVDLHMFQAWLAVATPSKCYTFPSGLFIKYGGYNVAVKNFTSHFPMLSLTMSNVKLAIGKMVHAIGIGIISMLCY